MSLLRAPRSHYEMVLKSLSLFYTMMVNRLNPVLRASNKGLLPLSLNIAPFLLGEQPDGPSLRGSNEHSFIVRVARARESARIWRLNLQPTVYEF